MYDKDIPIGDRLEASREIKSALESIQQLAGYLSGLRVSIARRMDIARPGLTQHEQANMAHALVQYDSAFKSIHSASHWLESFYVELVRDADEISEAYNKEQEEKDERYRQDPNN